MKNNEIERDDIVVALELLIDENNANVVNAYLETWFDVDKKFNIDTASDDDKWANMYADYNTATCELKLSIHVSDSEKTEVIEYTPTDAERKLIIAMMEEKSESIYGCSLKEMCAEYIDDTMELGGMA